MFERDLFGHASSAVGVDKHEHGHGVLVGARDHEKPVAVADRLPCKYRSAHDLLSPRARVLRVRLGKLT